MGARGRERGVALLVAVLATALLTVTVLEFTYSSQVAYRRTAHWLEAERARLAAESGVALAAEVLSFDGELAELVAKAEVPPEAAGLLEGLDPRLAKIDGALDLWAHCSEPGPSSCTQRLGAECTLPLTMTPMSDTSAPPSDETGYFTVRIEDETGFFNLNRLAKDFVSPDEIDRAIRLFRLADVDPSLVGPVVDWVDPDSSPLAYPPGAESSQYGAQDRDVPPRNKPMATFRELGLVLGMTGEDLRRLRRVATVLPTPSALLEREKINVNTAPLTVLQALGESLDPTELGSLHAQRCERPFLDKNDLLARVPEAGALEPLLTYQSSWFRVRSTAYVGDAVQSVEALLSRQGKRIDAAYLLAQRGANVTDVEMEATEPTGFETSITVPKGP
jgi:type II secretory pathway component PulK